MTADRVNDQKATREHLAPYIRVVNSGGYTDAVKKFHQVADGYKAELVRSGDARTAVRAAIRLRPRRHSASDGSFALMSDIAAARMRFRDAALAHWVSVQSGDSDGANEETEKSDAIVREWADQARKVELLKPLLVDADPEVRFAVASHVLDFDVPEVVTILEELRSADADGMIPPTARLRLMTRHRT